MAGNFELEWNGEELKAQIAAVAEENVMKSAQRVMKGAKRRVPVDNGYLKESIKIKKWKNKGVIGTFVQAGERGEDSGDTYIAMFVELGTPGDTMRVRQDVKFRTQRMVKGQLTWVKRRRRIMKRTPIKAKPYLRPALRAEKKKFIKSFEGAL